MNEEMMHETYAQDVKKYNYMISPSAFTTEIFQSAFRINRERLFETGYPRNDFLTNYTEEDVLNIKKKLGKMCIRDRYWRCYRSKRKIIKFSSY